ncbi:flagellar filament capping protein FliD [Vogesella indigofera]|uniref:flagellar filament capping protein FliD n=1 Tax=Vogesella indigofera TaxID=45465 RepID=UPI00234E72AF|nr:flagellar filament capping protein FliD [Vogesella indigofera]MDC7708128.1 flagellar filament capping protein FliD [Vogesella indigofera]
MALSSSGLGSGMDIDSLVSKLMNIETRPLLKLQQKQQLFESKISAVGQVKSGLASFQAALKALQDPAKYQALSSSSSDKDVAEISAGAKAPVGGFNLKVETLAAAQKLSSSLFTNSKSAINGATEETLSFSFGTTSGATFTQLSGSTQKDVKIPANATLEQVRDAVNKANIGVSASIVNDGSGYRLIYSSGKTGTESTLKVTAAGGVSSPLASLTHDPAVVGGTMTERQQAKDAVFYVDGLKITKQSNTVTDAIDGVTLTLKKEQEAGDAALKMNVSRDTAGIKKTMEDFVRSYNEFTKLLKQMTAATPGTAPGEAGSASPLNGVSTIRGIETQIRAAFSGQSNNGGTFQVASQLGISFSKDGTLSLDSSKLSKAIEASPDDVAKFFATGAQVDGKGISYVSSSAKTVAGSYDVSVDGLANGYNLADNTPTLLAVTGVPFEIKIDGMLVSTSIAADSYSASEMAKAIETAINSEPELTAVKGKVSVSVDEDSGKLLITSLKSGIDSKVEVVGGLEFAGFAASTGVAGSASVSGTIGGYAARGDGSKLIGAVGTPVEGLTIELSGGTIGDRGSLTYTQGFSFNLDKKLEGMLSTNGTLDSFNKGLNASLKDLQKQQDAMAKRLEATEARYKAQFNAMDRLLAQLNASSSFLSQQISSMQKSS